MHLKHGGNSALYDESSGDENAGAIIPHRSGWIFWLAGVKLHQC